MTERTNSIPANRSLPKSFSTTEEQVRLLYMQAPVSNIVIILISLLYYFILQPRLNSNMLLLWTLALLITASCRMSLWYLRRIKPESRSAASWLNYYLMGCGLTGGAWSLIYPFLHDTNDPFVLTALLMLAFGVISSAVPILSPCIPAFILYTYPQGLILSITLLRFQNKAYYALAFAVCTYMIMTTLFTRNISRSILKSIRLQEENTTLIKDLNNEISQREKMIAQRTLELKEKNHDLIKEIKIRKGTEEQLQQANADLDATLRAIPDLVFELDRNGKYINMWTQDTNLLVAQKEDLIGHTVNEILPSNAAFQVMAAIREAAETGTSQGQIIRLQVEHGGEYWFELSTSKKQHTGSNSHFLMLSRDITDKHQMEEELFKARKLESVGILAGGIAHDFNNILSSILGNIDLAYYRIDKQDIDTTRLLSDAKKATKRATKLTDQLLTFSKGGNPVKQKTSLATLVTESADFVLHGSNVLCNYSIPDHLWMVDVDSGQIGQVIQNIIVNAKHAMPEGGTVDIQCSNVQDTASEALLNVDKGDYVRITVNDTGVGIPKEIIDKVFDPYFTTKQEGSGLGLAICHSIVNKHEGYITVDSIMGKGTSFTIYLPALRSTERSTTEERIATLSVKSLRVMVMDDEEMLRNVASSQLAVLGHEPILVTDGSQAINRYQEMRDLDTPVDLVIMDLTIPGGMGGQEAAEKFLQIDPGIKIIVASGYSNDPVMANYKKYGFSAAIAKPFDLKELNNAIASAIGKP